MIITCPNCSTRFLIDPAALGPKGRSVRCRKCSHRWFAPAPAEQPRTTLGDVPQAAPIPPSPPQGRAREGRGGGVMLGWLAVALVTLLLIGAVVGRNEVVASFPQAAPVYQKLGLPVAVRFGLEFRSVDSRRFVEGGVTVLVVEGEIVNVSEGARPLPSVRVALLDDGRREIEAKTVRPTGTGLDAGESTRFEIRMIEPPPAARNFSVTFAP